MTILIVDDNETDRKVLRKILEREGIQTIEAEDGVEALTVLERERVDAVISDTIMPNMDGYQFCYELRQSLIYGRLPVIIYTSHFANENMEPIAREFGADLYLKKPSSPAQILEAVRTAREAQSHGTRQSPIKLPEVYRGRKTYSEWLIRKLEEQNDQLERSEERYRQLVELSPDGVVVVCQGEIVFANGACARILGATSPREIEGRKVMDFVHPDFKEIITRRSSDLMDGLLDRNPPIEQKLLRLHGGLIDVETMSTSFQFFDKPAVLVIVRDISERKQAQERLRESERDLSMAQRVAHVGSWALDLSDLRDVNKNPLSWSDEVFRIFGYEPGQIEVSNDNFFHCVPSEDRPAIQAAVSAALKSGTPYKIDHRVVRPNGEIRFVHEQAEIIRDEKTGQPVKLLGTVQDITERKRAEEALRESERALSTLVSNLPGIVYRRKNDHDWTMEYISEGALSLTGYSPADFLSKVVTYDSIIHPDDRQKVWDDIQKALRERRPFQIVYRIRTFTGDIRWFWEQGRAVAGPDGSTLALEGFITDITDRQRFALALQRSESNYRRLMEQAADAILIADAQGYYIDVNTSACELFGYTKEELLTKRLGDLSDPSEPPVLAFLLSLPMGQSSLTERKFRRKDGTLLIIEVSGKKLPDGRIQGVYHDITKRKRAEEELIKSEANYRMLMEQASDAILIADSKGNYIDANRRAVELLGYTREELLRKKVGELSHHSQDNPMDRLLRLEIGQTSVNERKCLCKDGTIRITEASGKRLTDGRFQVVLRDITERKRVEDIAKSQQAFIQRLAALLPSIVYVYDLIERKPFYINEAAGAILGYTPDELTEMGPGFIGKVMHPEDAALYQERVKKFSAAPDGTIVVNEMRLRHSGGDWRRFRCQEIIFNRDPDGRPRLILGMAQDISDRTV